MTFWKEWFLDAYYNKVYSLDKLKEKLKALEAVEEDWKNHINYNSYKGSINGLKAAIEHIQLQQHVENIKSYKPEFETSIHHPDTIKRYLSQEGTDTSIENICYFYANEEYQSEIDEAITKHYELADLDRWIHLMKVLDMHIAWDTAMSINSALWEENIEIMELKIPKEWEE